MSAALLVDEVDFSYGRLQVLFGVTLELRAGEALALLGTNGAGKSTLLRVIAGLDPPRRGSVTMCGADVTARAAEDMVEHGLVLVTGGRAVFGDMTVAENLEMQGFTLRRKRALLRERTARTLELFPRLGERLNQKAGSMSGGEQQQLALAKALMLDPRILCIDELSLGLAPVVVDALLEAVEAVRSTGVSMIVVEQSLNVAASICERAVFMEKGEVRFEGSTIDLVERDDLARAVFLGRAADTDGRPNHRAATAANGFPPRPRRLQRKERTV